MKTVKEIIEFNDHFYKKHDHKIISGNDWETIKKSIEITNNNVQQIQTKIQAIVSRIDIAVEKCDGCYSRVDIANELRELLEEKLTSSKHSMMCPRIGECSNDKNSFCQSTEPKCFYKNINK